MYAPANESALPGRKWVRIAVLTSPLLSSITIQFFVFLDSKSSCKALWKSKNILKHVSKKCYKRNDDTEDSPKYGQVLNNNNMTTITDLPRYCVSVILSFTCCEEDGTCFLLTNRHWTRHYLPIFAKPRNRRCHFYRRVIPVQDPTVLLDRYNSRKLHKRIKSSKHHDGEYYQTMMTNEQLANHEWSMIRQVHLKNTSEAMPWFDPSLELLRWRWSCQETVGPQKDNSEISLLASYPRSGNTWLRHLLERVTGLVTGSDTRPDRNLSRALSCHPTKPLVGEGIVEDSHVSVVKTHWPERRGLRQFSASRVVLIVRNPYDAIDSYWNLCTTNTHDRVVHDTIYQKYSSKWRGLVQSEMHTWKQFHEYWHSLQKSSLPILTVRYEDLVLEPQSTLERIIPFVLNDNHLDSDTFWRKRIQHVLQHETRKSTNSSIGKSLFKPYRYNDEMLQQIRSIFDDEFCSILQQYGYDIYHQGFPNNWKHYPLPPLLIKSQQQKNTDIKVIVNKGDELRTPTNPYGRQMTYWRHGETENDQKPFATQPRS